MKHFLLFTVTAFAIAAGFSLSSFAQIRASELATVSQVVDGTEMNIEYSRPSKRGRGDVVGDIVKFDYTWTPGANWATTIEFGKDVTINEHPVPAGKYSLWLVTNRGDWEVILDPEHRKWHVEYPKEKADQIRFMVTPGRSETVMETLLFSFPRVRADGAELRLHWGQITVDFDIRVQSTREFDVPADIATRFTGHYEVAIEESPFAPGHQFDTEIQFTGEYLICDIYFNVEDKPETILFAPSADQIFNLAWYISGEVAGVMEDMFIEFEMDGEGHASSFVVRLPTDDVWMRGSRIRP